MADRNSHPCGGLWRRPAARLTGGPEPTTLLLLILLRRKETITLLRFGSVVKSAPANCSQQKRSPPPPSTPGRLTVKTRSSPSEALVSEVCTHLKQSCDSLMSINGNFGCYSSCYVFLHVSNDEDHTHISEPHITFILFVASLKNGFDMIFMHIRGADNNFTLVSRNLR